MGKMATAAAMALALMLAGCSGGPVLDRDITLNRMSFRAPSSCAETRENDHSVSLVDKEDEVYIIAYHLDYYDSLDEVLDSGVVAILDESDDGWETAELDEGVDDGREFIVRECSLTSDDGERRVVGEACYFGPDGGYSITVLGGVAGIADVADTVAFVD